MAAILISVDDINFENLSCNKRGVHIWGEARTPTHRCFCLVVSKEHKCSLYVIPSRNPINHKPEIAHKDY